MSVKEACYSRYMKGLFIGIFIIVLLGLGSAFLSAPAQHQQPSPVVVSKELVSYIGPAALSFLYPNMYTLTERGDGYEGNPIVVMTLIDNGVVVPDYSEGPTAMTILAIPNPKNLPLNDWIQTKSISNFYMSADKKLSPITVGGEAGLAYTHTGLYENDAAAVAHAGRIYLFFVSWTDAASPMRVDFQNLLKTVTFK